MKQLKIDVLVIGTGVAGCVTALELSRRGIPVVLLTRAERPDETATGMAQGGIVFRGEGDRPEKLIADLEEAGAGLTFREAAEILAHEGPEATQRIFIDRLAVPFDRNQNGEFKLTKEAAHSIPRILYAGDHTGREIEAALLRELSAQKNVTILTRHTAVDLLTLAHHSLRPQDIYERPRCIGAYAFDQVRGEMVAILAKETVLATGGLGRLYLHSTNPMGARGDGLAMAYRTGARVMNLEYIQFHPTALYSKTPDRFLISEALRGEGARLYNEAGEEFMPRYDSRGTLAPRDVVARAIAQELFRDHTRWVYLDISHKPADWIRQRFPAIYAECSRQGIDITTEPIPVVPAAHYSCGGVAVDLCGDTSIQNLKAVGEVACTGLHGANRLASTSLLEGLVFGSRAATDIATKLGKGTYAFPPIREWESEHETLDDALVAQDWFTIQHTMWNYVGLIRTTRRLERAQRILGALTEEVEKFYAHSELSDPLIGLRNASVAAQLVLTAARRNRRSLGCHYLADETLPEAQDGQSRAVSI